MRTDLKTIEILYDIRIQFDNASLVIENCPEKILNQVERKIELLLANNYTRVVDLGYLPGIKKILEHQDGSLFRADLKQLEGIHFCYYLNLFLFYLIKCFFKQIDQLETVVFAEVKRKFSDKGEQTDNLSRLVFICTFILLR